jgi:hypothetical protein
MKMISRFFFSDESLPLFSNTIFFAEKRTHVFLYYTLYGMLNIAKAKECLACTARNLTVGLLIGSTGRLFEYHTVGLLPKEVGKIARSSCCAWGAAFLNTKEEMIRSI